MANRLKQAVQMHIGPRGMTGLTGGTGPSGPTGPQGPAGTGIFESLTVSSVDIVRYNSALSLTTFDFVIPDTNSANKFYFDVSAGSFRLGSTTGSFTSDINLGTTSMAFGNASTVTHNNSFVWSDSIARTSVTHNSVLFGAKGGVILDVGQTNNVVGLILQNLTSTAGSITPLSDDSVDLGSASLRFRDIYLGSNIFVPTNTVGALSFVDSSMNTILTLDSTINNKKILFNASILPSINNTYDIGSTTQALRNLNFANGSKIITNGSDKLVFNSTNILFGSTLLPATNNAFDIGSNSQSIKNLNFASGSRIIANNTDRFTFNPSDITFSNNLLPGTTNFYDIGSNVYSIKNMNFASGSKIIANNTDRFTFTATETRVTGAFSPATDNNINFGSATQRWATANATTVNSTTMNATTINASGTITGGTLTTAGTVSGYNLFATNNVTCNNANISSVTSNSLAALNVYAVNFVSYAGYDYIYLQNSGAVARGLYLGPGPQQGFPALYPSGNAITGLGDPLRRWATTYATSYNSSSDLQLKENIQDITYGLDYVRNVRTVGYSFKNMPDDEVKHDRYHTGWIAQEVLAGAEKLGIEAKNFAAYSEDSIPESEYTAEKLSSDAYFCTDRKLRGIRATELTAILWAAVRDLDAEVTKLKDQVASLTK